MIWFFERGPDSLKIETRFNNDAGTFELIWYLPNGSQTLETFLDEGQFRDRSAAIEAELLQEDWQPAESPQLLRDGWKLG